MRYFFIFLFIISCNGKQEKKNISSIDITQHRDLLSITCSLKSLDGIMEIYKINKDSIYSDNVKKKIKKYDYEKIMNVPKTIYKKGGKYGCGVCTDEVDFIFLFDFGNKQTIWEIEPNIKLPKETEEYFTLLINKYKQFVHH